MLGGKISSQFGKLFEQSCVKPSIKHKQTFFTHEEMILVWLVGLRDYPTSIHPKDAQNIFRLLLTPWGRRPTVDQKQ